jgi:hypothetical protein
MKGEAGSCELLGHGLLRGPRGEGARPQTRARERRPVACRICGLRRKRETSQEERRSAGPRWIAG